MSRTPEAHGSGFDVAIVGAGAAGLAATAILRRAGRRCILIEAGTRIGGRAHTVRPACLGGARFDTGATWLHQTDRNPLVALARAQGIALRPAHQGAMRLFVDDRAATCAESAAYDKATAAWERQARDDASGPDRPLCEAGGPAGPWTANIENWQGSIIAAADARTIGLHDWRRNLLDDSDLSPPEGVGTLLAELLGPMAGEVAFGRAISAIDWSGTTGCVLNDSQGSIHANAIIVTVSTGVLRAGGIAFTPTLPDATRTAIDGLPMGLLSKLALPATGDDRLGLAAGTLLERRLASRGAGGMLLAAWPEGLPYVAGFFGGSMAWDLADAPEAALAQARAGLRRLFGDRADAALARDAGFVTDWGRDPLFAGAYAYCPPGRAASRAMLAEPVGGRLLLAGEACRTDGLAGTVGGALLDGERAAHWLLAEHFGVHSPPRLADGFPADTKPV